MQKPEVWRELKRFEYDKVRDEQKQPETTSKKSSKKSKKKPKTQSRQDYEDFEQDMQFDNADDLNKEILKEELEDLEKQQEAAAKKIGKQARVRFNLPEDKPKDSFVDEYLNLMDRSGYLDAKYYPEDMRLEAQKKQAGVTSAVDSKDGIDWYQDGRLSRVDLEPSNKGSRKGSDRSQRRSKGSRAGSRVLGVDEVSQNISVWDLSEKQYI